MYSTVYFNSDEMVILCSISAIYIGRLHYYALHSQQPFGVIVGIISKIPLLS